MATKKQTVTKKRSATATQITNQRHNKPSDGKREVWAILLFALAIFLVFLIFVKGQNIWLDLHNFVFGLNGIGAYLLPVFVGAIAVIIGLDKLRDSAAVRVAECAGVFWVFLAAVDIIITKADVFETYGEHLKNAYTLGTGIKGGGFFGALIGNAIFKAFGKVGATVTIFLILFVMLMLLTGTTLIRFLQTVAKPVKHIEKQAERNYANAQQRRAEQEDPSKWDIPIEEEQRPARTAKKAEVGTQATFEDISSTTPDTSAKEAAERAVQAAEKTAPQPMSEAEKAAFAEKFGQEIIANAETEEKTYELPPLSLLKSGKSGGIAAGKAELQQTAESLVNVLRSFGVETRVLDISRGPTVTRYELQPSAGVKISKITGLADDIALNLATAGVRIEAPIPNKAAVGIEVPNKTNGMVTVREILESEEFVNAKSKLSVVMGRDIAGKAVVTDIAKMPHGLIAGSTGSGKSVCINSIIMSLLYRATPDEVKLLMIDPKVVELNVYNGIPHLLAPVVTDPRKASGALGWAVQEMEKRYRLFAENDVRNLEGYNHLAELSDDMVKMPQIVIIIDELADLMMTCPGDVEDSICRIAQKARAAGMHLIVATQRPSVDVVTGLIKANVPTRIAFMVSSQTDSRTILDMGGAEKLLGKGDMLFCPVGANKPTRIQGCFVSDGEVENVVEYIKKHCDGEHQYDSAVCEGIEKITAAQREKGSKTISSGDDDNDPMIDQAIEFCVESGKASTSMLQRHLKLGYARAARIIDQLEAMGVVGPFEGGSRQVLMTKAELEERRAREE